MIELAPFTTTEDDMKNGVSKIPKKDSVAMTEEDIKVNFSFSKKRKSISIFLFRWLWIS